MITVLNNKHVPCWHDSHAAGADHPTHISFAPTGPKYAEMTPEEVLKVGEAITERGYHVQIINKGWYCYKRWTLEKLDHKIVGDNPAVEAVLEKSQFKLKNKDKSTRKVVL